MKVLEVIPIARGITSESLSYFSQNDIPVGSIVKVPVRKKLISAIVISAHDAYQIKSELKNSPFALKKVEKVKSSDLFKKEFIDAASDMAEYYVGSTGSVISLMAPKILFDMAGKIKVHEDENRSNKIAERFVLQSNDEDRYSHYKSIIREEFAKGSSVLFILPTAQDIKRAVDILQKGIEKFTFAFHSYLGNKELKKDITKLLDEKHPVLIISTGRYISIPKDVGTIIIDKENSRSYKIQKRPYVDIRNFAENYANKINAKLILGDIILRAETIYRHKKGELHEIAPLKFRSTNASSEVIVDMRKNQSDSDKKFRMIGSDLEQVLKNSIENNEHLFLFVARRGLSPITVCGDCENVVKCKTCGAHTVLHKSSSENFFLCHKCGERRTANEKCGVCGSWKLNTLGIGAELVEEKIKEIYPKSKIFRIDADTTDTHNKALDVVNKFYSSDQGILIGTEMALSYLTEKVENTAVVSLDSFFSIPDFRINERILNILVKIRSITQEKMIVQTRDINQKIFDYVLKGNLVEFFRDEIDDRKKLGYPPFSTIIKISVTGAKNEISQIMENFQKDIEPYEIDIFPAFVPIEKGKFSINGIIKVPANNWPDASLSSKLRSLPMNCMVNVDPETLI